MKTKTSLLLLTMVATLGLSGPVVAKKFTAPEGLVCEPGFDNSVYSHWDGVEDASHYAVDVTAEYDVNEDGATDRSYDFNFGTSDPELVLEQRDLMGKFVDDNGATVEKKAKGAKMRVKAMQGGKGHDKWKGYEKGQMKAKGKGHYKEHGNKHSEFAECQVAFEVAAPPPCRGFCR